MAIGTVTERLLKLKDEIEQAKLDMASIDGALKQNLQRLKDEFKCRSVESAKVELEFMNEKRDKIKAEITKSLEKLEAEYDW